MTPPKKDDPTSPKTAEKPLSTKKDDPPAVPADVTPATAAHSTEEFEWKGEKRTRAVRTLTLGGEKVEFVKVPRGSFLMGSPNSDKKSYENEKPRHTVTFTKDLWVAKHPTTKGQFAAFVKATGYKTEAEADGEGGAGFDGKNLVGRGKEFTWKETGWNQTDRHPVVNVSWNDSEAFCRWAAGESKVKVRLPTEAEYEYANRGGADTIYFTGDDVASLEGYANIADKSAKAKWKSPDWAGFDDGEPFTSAVSRYKPNGFGLYDTTGNVRVWCSDFYVDKTHPRGEVTDPPPNAKGVLPDHVLRGCCWAEGHPEFCRAAYRYRAAPSLRYAVFGFRVCFHEGSPAVRTTDGLRFVPLFNGRDLTGWKKHKTQAYEWQAENGMIVGIGQTPSHLYTERDDFGDFYLRAECRVNDGGNSGVCARTGFGPTVPTGRPVYLGTGYEAQINVTHTEANKTGGLFVGSQEAAGLVDKSPVKADQWFTLEVIAEGDRVVVKVDGVLTADFTDGKRRYSKGHIALQKYDAKTVCQFRKVEIAELPASK